VLQNSITFPHSAYLFVAFDQLKRTVVPGKISSFGEMISNVLVFATGILLFYLFLGWIIPHLRTTLTCLAGGQTSIQTQVLQNAFRITFDEFSFYEQERSSSDIRQPRDILSEPETLRFPLIYPVLRPETLCESRHTPAGYPVLPTPTLSGEIHTFPNIYPSLSDPPGEKDSTFDHVPSSHCPVTAAENVSIPITGLEGISTTAQEVVSRPQPSRGPPLPPGDPPIPRAFRRKAPEDPRTSADFLPKTGAYLIDQLGKTEAQKTELRTFLTTGISEFDIHTKSQPERFRRRRFREIWRNFLEEERPHYLRNRVRIPPGAGFELASQKYPCKYIPNTSSHLKTVD
jgi:hypothetical protein